MGTLKGMIHHMFSRIILMVTDTSPAHASSLVSVIMLFCSSYVYWGRYFPFTHDTNHMEPHFLF